MGKRFGDMTPAEKKAAIERARDQLQAELTAMAPAIGRVLEAAEAEPVYGPDGTRPQESWVPELDPADPACVAGMTCDMLAWRLGEVGASPELRMQVGALARAIREELGNDREH